MIQNMVQCRLCRFVNTCADSSARFLVLFTEDGSFEEVEGKDEEERCGKPVTAHQKEESTLVVAE